VDAPRDARCPREPAAAGRARDLSA
jgi:hypothetical protein